MYASKAVVKTIKATSRVAIKIRDNYFTVEYSEEREIPNDETVDIQEEREQLFTDVNSIVDMQVIEIQETFKK